MPIPVSATVTRDLAVGRFAAYGHRAAGRSVLDGVVEQVEEELTQSIRIAPDRAGPGRSIFSVHALLLAATCM